MMVVHRVRACVTMCTIQKTNLSNVDRTTEALATSRCIEGARAMTDVNLSVVISEIPRKICIHCCESIPCVPEHFGKNSARPDGFQKYCKQCDELLYGEKKRARSRAYAKAHAIEARARAAAWRTNHPDYRAHQRLYRMNNLARMLELEAQAREKHRDQRNEAQRTYHKIHPDVASAATGRRRARKACVALNDLTAAQWQEIKAAYGYRCVYCGRKMQRLTMDHITPLSKGGNHTASNIVPACQSCNARKYVGNVLIPIQPLLLTIASPKGV